MLFGQGARVLPREVVQNLPLALRAEDGAGRIRLHAPHFEAQGGTAVKQGQQFAIHGVDLEAQPLKRFGLFRGCGLGPAVRGIVGFGHGYISRMFS